MRIRLVRYYLAIILFIIALNALGGGLYGMAGAKDIPLPWLKGSPFKNYFIPSLFLFLIVGGTCLLSSIFLFRNSRFSKQLAAFSGLLLILWIAVQVWMIGYVSWLQPAVFTAGITIVALALFLPRKSS